MIVTQRNRLDDAEIDILVLDARLVHLQPFCLGKGQRDLRALRQNCLCSQHHANQQGNQRHDPDQGQPPRRLAGRWRDIHVVQIVSS